DIDSDHEYKCVGGEYDRFHTSGFVSFHVEGPPGGSCDPLAGYFSFGQHEGNGHFMFPEKMDPIRLTSTLNEWVRFDKPGTYRVYCLTWRLAKNDEKLNFLPLCSPVVEIQIVPATDAFVAKTLLQAKALLSEGQKAVTQWEGAKMLRYLGDRSAIDLLVP